MLTYGLLRTFFINAFIYNSAKKVAFYFIGNNSIILPLYQCVNVWSQLL